MVKGTRKYSGAFSIYKTLALSIIYLYYSFLAASFANMFTFKISKVIPTVNDCIQYEFESPKDYPAYLAGQFLSLVFQRNGKELRRSYSFHSSPAVDEALAITVKRVENGEISRFMHHQLEQGDTLQVQAPQGMFSYSPQTLKPRTIFLFAAGVGITPLFSILKTALLQEKQSRVVLVYSNRNAEDTLFRETLLDWQQRFPEQLHIIWIYSNAKNLFTARLNRFYIEEILHKELIYDKSEALFYSCGPIIYMDLCRFTLLGLGFEAAQIKRETFVLPEDEVDEDDTSSAEPADTNTYQVEIIFNNKHYEFPVPYNQRILDAALARQIPLPYSCKSGMCSTCVATCIQGGVRMDYNEVLMDDEIEQGRVLVCTAHPTSNDTVITYDA